MLRFRESFRGYNRDDVNAYIEQINIHFSKKEAELRAIIADLEAQSALKASAHNDDEFTALTNEIEALKAENSRLNEELQKANQSIENEIEEKSKLYDSMSTQVGSIIIQANSNADKIVAEAKTEAENIKVSATIKSKEIIDEATKKKEEAIAFIDDLLAKASREYLSEYTKVIDETNAKLITISESVYAKAETMLSVLDNKTSNIKAE
jgi:cell division septum initiation protein DivIVA